MCLLLPTAGRRIKGSRQTRALHGLGSGLAGYEVLTTSMLAGTLDSNTIKGSKTLKSNVTVVYTIKILKSKNPVATKFLQYLGFSITFFVAGFGYGDIFLEQIPITCPNLQWLGLTVVIIVYIV